ncbi:MAG: adenylate/guanylate cyclase domain-containing protein, partial [Planctomycetia bacterium]
AKDRNELFESVVQVIHASIPADNVCLCLLNDQGQAAPVAVKRRNGDAATPMTISRSVTGEVLANNRAVLVTDASMSGSATLTDLKIRSVLCVPVYHNGKTSGLIYADSLSIDQTFNKQHLELLAALALLAAVGFDQFAMREDAQRKRQMIDRLGRYVEGPVVDRLMNMKHGDAPLEEMQAEERELTVMFADVCGFTSMSENMQPREVADVLNEIFGKLTEAVFRFQGTVDKFLGDGILAFFGAPVELENHALNAVEAALQMQKEVEAYNTLHPERKPLRMRIGVNSGRAIVGDLGSPKRKEYTVIGDTVNVASRFESSVAKPGEVVVGELTYERIAALPFFEFTAIGPVPLKGKAEMLQPYKVEYVGDLMPQMRADSVPLSAAPTMERPRVPISLLMPRKQD